MNSIYREIREPKFQATALPALAKGGLSADTVYNAINNGSKSQALESRNDVKRVINNLAESAKKSIDAGDTEATDKAFAQTDALGKLVAALDDRISLLDWGNSMNAEKREDGFNVLRGSEAIKAHYKKGASGEDQTMTTGDFFRGVARMNTSESVRNALSVGTNTSGGFSVPSVVMGDILSALVPQSSLLTAGAGIVDLGIGAKTFTTAAVDALPTAAWRLENGTVAESEPTFRGVVATPQSLAFLFKVSRELLADSPNMNQALLLAITQAFARELDRAGLRGTGTAPEPRGILNTAGIQAVANGANGAALAGYANLFSAYQKILEANAPAPTAAIMSPRSLIKLGGLVATDNQPLNVPPMLQPLQMLATSAIPNNLTVGTSTDCSEMYIGDFTRVAFMLRENVSVQLADQLYAGNGQVGFICHVRADVACLYPAALSVVTGIRA